MRSNLIRITSAAALSLSLIGTASAQSMRVPLQDGVVDTSGSSALSSGAAYGLPGVGMGVGSPTISTTGPGGLRNGVGAIGSGPPSTSSHNPVLVEPPAGTGLSIPIEY